MTALFQRFSKRQTFPLTLLVGLIATSGVSVAHSSDSPSAATAPALLTQNERVRLYYEQHPGLRRFRENLQQIWRDLQLSGQAARDAQSLARAMAAVQARAQQSNANQLQNEQSQQLQSRLQQQRQLTCLSMCQAASFCKSTSGLPPAISCSNDVRACENRCN